MSSIPSETEIRNNVAERAEECPGCAWVPEGQDVTCTRSQDFDEEYHGLSCPKCSWRYEDDQREWYKPTAPGEETPRVQR